VGRHLVGKWAEAAASIRTRHYAAETNGVVERFHRSLKYEHRYQHGIDNAAELAGEVAA
jgi:hypothetical protein